MCANLTRSLMLSAACGGVLGGLPSAQPSTTAALPPRKVAHALTRFGDYKKAHLLDKRDPRWLHEKEVDMVKVVLCRFVTAQLDGLSLRNALFKTSNINLRQAESKADKIVEALMKGLRDGGDGSASTCTYGFLLQTVQQENAATEVELEALLDHFHARLLCVWVCVCVCVCVCVTTSTAGLLAIPSVRLR